MRDTFWCFVGVSFQCMDLFHTHSIQNTKRRSSRECWTWELIQFRAFRLNGTTKISSGKSKSTQRILTHTWREIHQLKDTREPTFPYLSCVYVTSIFAFLEALFLLWLLCIIDIRINILKLILIWLFCGVSFFWRYKSKISQDWNVIAFILQLLPGYDVAEGTRSKIFSWKRWQRVPRMRSTNH